MEEEAVVKPQVVVQPLHFEDLSGSEFERLCFAYLWHFDEWKTLEWYGQLGGDGRGDSGSQDAGETGVLKEFATFHTKVSYVVEVNPRIGIVYRYYLKTTS